MYLYVDDLIFSGNCATVFDEFKISMMDEFEIVQSNDGNFLSQKKYAGEIVKKIQMKDCIRQSLLLIIL
jgi:hypothetical protein